MYRQGTFKWTVLNVQTSSFTPVRKNRSRILQDCKKMQKQSEGTQVSDGEL